MSPDGESLSLGAAVWGVSFLLLTASGHALFGVWLRRRTVPELVGPAAVLGAAVAAVAAAVVEAEVLGLVSLLRAAPVLVTAIAAPALAVASTRGLPAAAASPGVRLSRWDLLGLGAGVALGLFRWAAQTRYVLSHGFDQADAVNYHLPYAAAFVQDHAVHGYYFVQPQAISTFHPLNAELLDAVAMLPLRRDVLLLHLNLGWFALAVLAAWTLGRATGRAGAGGVAVFALGTVLATPIMQFSVPGEVANDLVGMALVLAAAALLTVVPRTLGGATLPALAGGLAAGTKSSDLLVGAVIALLSGLSVTGRKRQGLVVAAAAALVGGGFWYIRNAVLAGSPVPTISLPGLPHVDLGATGTYSFSVVHYLFDGSVVRHVYLPGLGRAVGVAWPLLLVAAVLTPILVLVLRGETANRRLLAAVSLLGLLGYAITPTGAFGPPGHPLLFWLNTRYAAAPVALALVLGVTAAVWFRSRILFGGLVAVLVALGVQDVWSTGSGRQPMSRYPVSLLACLLVSAVGAAVALVIVARPHVFRTLALLVTGVIVIAGVGVSAARMATHDASPRAPLAGIRPAVTQLDPHVLAESGNAFPYVLIAPSLRRVVVLGRELAHGGFETFRTCTEFRAALHRSGADALVVAGPAPGSPLPPEAGWARSDPQLTEVASSPGALLYRVDQTEPSGDC